MTIDELLKFWFKKSREKRNRDEEEVELVVKADDRCEPEDEDDFLYIDADSLLEEIEEATRINT